MSENFRRHLILWSGGIASKKPSFLVIMSNNWQREFFELLVALAKVFLVVVAAMLRDLTTNRAMLALAQLRHLTGPPAVGAFDALADALEQNSEGHFKRDRTIDRELVLR